MGCCSSQSWSPTNSGGLFSGVGCQKGAQSSKISVPNTAKGPSPAMVKYLEEQDAYKSFLVGGHLARRLNIEEAGSKAERARNTLGGDKDHVTSE